MKLMTFLTTILFVSNLNACAVQDDYEAGNKRVKAYDLEEIGEFTLALEYYQKSNELSLSFGNNSYLTDNYQKMGEIYYKQGKYQLALFNFEKSIGLLHLHYNDNKFIIATLSKDYQKLNLLINIGKSLSALGRYNEARESYDKYLEITRSNNDVVAEAFYYFLLGSLETRLKNVDIAEQYYHKAFTIINSPKPIQPNLPEKNPLEQMANNLNSQSKDLLMQLGSHEKDRGNNKIAYEYYKKAAADRSGLLDFRPRVLLIDMSHRLMLNDEVHQYGAGIRKDHVINSYQGRHDGDHMMLGNIEFENKHLDLAREIFLFLLPKYENYLSNSKSHFESEQRQRENQSYDLKIMQNNYEQLSTLLTKLANLEQKAGNSEQVNYYQEKVVQLEVVWEEYKIKNNILHLQ